MSARRPELEEALAEAMARLLEPVARLAMARGLRFQEVQEWTKQAFVRVARAQAASPGMRDVSRVAITTGLTRREVKRLSEARRPARADRSSPATQLFTRWMSDPDLRNPRGQPAQLPRRGPAPSFESVARTVTQDVHPRRLLEELLRLGLVEHDEQADVVRPLREAVVPGTDELRMLGFLGDNAGDHLAAGVANVLGEHRKHFEQAVFADGLSDESVEIVKKLVRAQWRALTAALVPELQDLVEQDRARPADASRRLRVGLYSFDEAMDDEATDGD